MVWCKDMEARREKRIIRLNEENLPYRMTGISVFSPYEL